MSRLVGNRESLVSCSADSDGNTFRLAHFQNRPYLLRKLTRQGGGILSQGFCLSRLDFFSTLHRLLMPHFMFSAGKAEHLFYATMPFYSKNNNQGRTFHENKRYAISPTQK
jgi:hypothetical protein